MHTVKKRGGGGGGSRKQERKGWEVKEHFSPAEFNVNLCKCEAFLRVHTKFDLTCEILICLLVHMEVHGCQIPGSLRYYWTVYIIIFLIIYFYFVSCL